MQPSTVRWTVLVPMRVLPAAKSRLAEGVPGELHADLVRAIRADSLAAVHATSSVARIVVVTDAPGIDDVAGAEVIVQRSRGLNGALRDGARRGRERWPVDGTAALVGDLPALRAEELAAALDVAADHPAAYVADTAGTGTTLLTAAPGQLLDPRFGAGSAARHHRSAVRLAAGPGLCQDVDTVGDLMAARELGLGPRTDALLGGTGLVASSPAVQVEGA